MLEASVAILDDVVAALSGAAGGLSRRDGENAEGKMRVPSWWLHSDSQSPSGWGREYVSTMMYLDIWANSRGELRDMLESVNFLKGYKVLEQAGAWGLEYRWQSTTIATEPDHTEHATLVFSVLYSEKEVYQG